MGFPVGLVTAVAVGLATFLALPAMAAPDDHAQSLVIPCEGLPADAVTSVPAPFDQFVELICTRSGQALKPVDGYAWVFDVGATWLSATNPHGPSKTDHYTRLVVDPLRQAEVDRLRAELNKLTPNPTLARREFIRLDVETSWAARKQIYLVLREKDGPPDEHTLGMECIHNCVPIDKDPWYFSIEPTASATGPK